MTSKRCGLCGLFSVNVMLAVASCCQPLQLTLAQCYPGGCISLLDRPSQLRVYETRQCSSPLVINMLTIARRYSSRLENLLEATRR